VNLSWGSIIFRGERQAYFLIWRFLTFAGPYNTINGWIEHATLGEIEMNVMKKFGLAIMVMVLLLGLSPSDVLAAPQGQTIDLVRFTVENRDEAGITLRLYATDGTLRAYYLRVDGGSTRILTPEAGIYNYTLTACGIQVRGTVDLTRNHNWVLPPCGFKGGPGTKAPNTSDVSEEIRLVRVDLVNTTSTRIQVRLYGPWDYVFTIEGKDTKVVTILKGEYDYTMFACQGGFYTGHFLARANKIQEFECK
jgi:hypothetical protein